MDDIRCLWGRGFVASAGSETTPLTAVAYDKDQPEIVLSVPAGTGIWVYRAEIFLESFAGTDNEIIMWTTTNAVGAGTSAAMTEQPSATNGLSTVSSNVTARQLYTGNITQTNYREVWRGGQTLANTNPGRFVFPEPGMPAIFVPGAGSFGIQIAASTTQPTFFAKVYWIETATPS